MKDSESNYDTIRGLGSIKVEDLHEQLSINACGVRDCDLEAASDHEPKKALPALHELSTSRVSVSVH